MSSAPLIPSFLPHNIAFSIAIVALGACLWLARALVVAKAARNASETLLRKEKEARWQSEKKVNALKQQLSLRSPSIEEYRMKPIGFLRTPYVTRNGTPRQGRAILPLLPHCHGVSSLDSLGEYSHCWLVFVFHQNTNQHKQSIPSKIHPPRLKGRKVGLFATRTPHRPNPIGLSLVKIEGINGGTLYLSGVDLVDGTPILDIKPYSHWDTLPFSTCTVRVPEWMEDLTERPVTLTQLAEERLHQFYHRFKNTPKNFVGSEAWRLRNSLFASQEEAQQFIAEVLKFEIRSRVVLEAEKRREAASEAAYIHEIELDRFLVKYTVDDDRVTVVNILYRANRSPTEPNDTAIGEEK